MEATPRLRPAARPDAALLALGLLAVALGVPLLLARLPLPVAAALCLTGVAAAAAMAWPLVGLLLFLGLIYVRPQDTFAELVPMRLALVVAGASVLGWGMRALAARRFPAIAGPTAWMLAFMAACILSAVLIPGVALADRFNVLARIGMILLLISQLVTSSRRLEIFCGFLVLWSGWLAVVAIAGYYGGGALATTEGLRARGTGVFDDPNGAAIALVPAVPLAVLAVLESRRLLLRVAAALAGLAMVWAIYLTNSRGGFLALAAALFVLAALRWGRRGLALGLLGCLAILAVGPSRLGATRDLDDSASDRIVAWQTGLDLFRSRPLTGVGMQQFDAYHELTAHNSFVLALAELGLVGTVCWVGLFVAVMRRSTKARMEADLSHTLLLDGGVTRLRGRRADVAPRLRPAGTALLHSPLRTPEAALRRPAIPGVRNASSPVRPGLRILAASAALTPRRPVDTWLQVNNAALAALVGILVGGMFLSDTYSEIPFIYLGLGAAVTGHLVGRSRFAASRLTGRRAERNGGRTGGEPRYYEPDSAPRGVAGLLRSDLAFAVALTLVGVAGLAVVVQIAG